MIRLKNLLLLVLLSVVMHAGFSQSASIAPMSWHERSDWINVKTDPGLSIHAQGDGITDDTLAIQQALDLASSSDSQVVVYLPAGTYKITDTLYWTTGTYGIVGRGIIGCGTNTVLEWHGSEAGTMFFSTGNSKARYIGITWDGRGIASRAMHFEPHNAVYGIAEAPMRIFNSAFLDFDGPALDFSNPSNLEWSGQADIWNCLFYSCEYGMQISSVYFNNYEYMVEACHFENCTTAIDSGNNSSQMVFDTRFINSSNTDITGRGSLRVRHCISTGSTSFIAMPQHIGGGYKHVVQDCWVDSWTEDRSGIYSGAIRFADKSSNMIFDCKFTSPPNSDPPINIINSSTDEPHTLLISNNSSEGFSTQSAMVQTGAGGGDAELLVVDVSPADQEVGITSILDQPDHVFLCADSISDGSQILDVTQAPYYAANDFSSDATAAIQQAINDAKSANNGTIVYLPNGYYRITSTLTIDGSNYTVEGGGYWSHLCWDGADNSTVLHVDSPDNVCLESFVIKTTDATIGTDTIVVSSDSVGRLDVDGIWHRKYTNSYRDILQVGDAGGVVLDTLPSGFTVYVKTLFDHLTVHDCGAATILGNRMQLGRIVVDGTTQEKTGFLGFLYANTGVLWLVEEDTGECDINILDNQDIVIGDYYNEQTFNNLYMEDGDVSWSGRVTIQGFKRGGWSDNYAIYVNNYEGVLFYGPQSFHNDQKTAVSRITHVGTNPFCLILALDRFHEGLPIVSLGTGASLLQVLNTLVVSSTYSLIPNVPSSLASSDYEAIAGGLDHLRELGLLELALLREIESEVAYEWFDSFASATGSGSDSIVIAGEADSYSTTTLLPSGGETAYTLYYEGNTAYELSLSAGPSAVGSKSGLTLSNDTGTAINTNYGGINSSEINIASLMGWTVGSITKEQVGALILLFDYQISGFPSNWFSIGLSASSGSSSKTIKTSVEPSVSAATGAYMLVYESESDLQEFADILNTNNGVIRVIVRIPGGYADAGATLCIADLWLGLPFYWFEDFTSVTGVASDACTISGDEGDYATVTMLPTGAIQSYKFYCQGNSSYELEIKAQQSAIGSDPGIVINNITGTEIDTVYGGVKSSEINISSLMGWTPGSITTTQVEGLELAFDYTCSGFNNYLSVGLLAIYDTTTASLREYYASTEVPVSALFSMSSRTQAEIQAFTDCLNANGGYLQIVVLIPSGSANDNASIALANLHLE